MSKITLSAALISMSFAISNLAHASGAVDYSCAGYIPNSTQGGPLSQESVVFHMTGANDGITIEIVSKSQSQMDPANKFLDAGQNCKFSMEPDAQYPAYRISVLGKCGTKIQQNFKGICFFDL